MWKLINLKVHANCLIACLIYMDHFRELKVADLLWLLIECGTELFCLQPDLKFPQLIPKTFCF